MTIALVECVVSVVSLMVAPSAAQEASRPLVPAAFRLSDSASKAIAEDWLKPDERKDLRVFHGVWDERDLDAPSRAAQAALFAWRLDDPALHDEAAPAVLRAEARLLAGDPEGTLGILGELDSMRAVRLRAQALETLGRVDDADAAVEPAVALLLRRKVDRADDLVDGVEALMVRARVRGQPAKDFQTMVTLLGQAHQDIDRLHWPARLAEARLLLEKDNDAEAINALHEALALNPRSSDAWALLGQVALARFDFEGARTAAAALRRINPSHPLADCLLAEAALVQDDPDAAQAQIAATLGRWPAMRRALALQAATEALAFDDTAMRAALARCDELSPGAADAWHLVGRHLSAQRQYEIAADILGEAVRRRPAWPAPRIELGLLEMQSGRDDRARQALEEVTKIDPFNKRAANSLVLLQELDGFTELESRHFLIRHRPGPDEVVARMMPGALDAMHEDLVRRFDHTPARKTVIELMPDHQFFSVRITGAPWIHTIAACTGPVIALEAPRDGPKHLHLGPYDWLQVLRHEYAHTITLDQTRNRIPHWLTEAAAVSIETAPRNYETCKMLARELAAGTLFDLDEINWAFVRPRRPQDRQLAYAQGAWMVEFMNARFGDSAVVRLVDRYFDGVREERAIPDALGISRDEFFRDFLAWAAEQVKGWGLAASPSMSELSDRLRAADPALLEQLKDARQTRLDAATRELTERIGATRLDGPDDAPQDYTRDAWPPLARPSVTIDDATLAAWRQEFPDHPDLLELALRRRERSGAALDADGEALVRRYLELRPVDPLPHRILATALLAGDDPQKAVPHLIALDAYEVHSAAYALELARLHRAAGRFDEALTAVNKAVRITGYDAATRELAAAIAIEAGKIDEARMHLEALVVLEPDRDVHRKRLEALAKLGG